MIEIVRVALRRPYTFVVLALLLLLIGPLVALRTPTDIFPDIRIPVIAVVWQYTGLPPDEMSGRITTLFQRSLTTTVNDIEHIEANSYTGSGIIKVFFQPGVDIAVANAQVTAISQTVLRQMPLGTTPPLILNYNASTVPILQLALSGKGMSEQALADLALNAVRIRLITVPGAAIPFPYGGKTRQILIALDPPALQARGLTAQDVGNALAAQNLITPIGTQKIDAFEYTLQLNSAASVVQDLGDLPIKVINGSTIYIRDVAQVRDGNAPQTNIVHVDGTRSVVMSVLKNGVTSTLAIVAGTRSKLVEIKPALPANLQVTPINDQSLFVRAAIKGVALEGAIAAVLTSVMILLFLGSWRSTVIVAVSIPLSILGAIICLAALGETLNIMTLGGLALAVGILVDDATVTIESINLHLEEGKDIETAIMDGATQIATPAFVSLLCICIVFVPMFFLEGVARFLFVPMAVAVMLSIAWSFLLSRTLVPTMAKYLLQSHAPHDEQEQPPGNSLMRFQRRFEARFEHGRGRYREYLALALAHRRIFVICFLAFVLASFLLLPFLGRNFFPAVDSGQILMHARTQVGTRVEETANQFAEIQKAIRKIIPPHEIEVIVDNIGLPPSSINLTYNNTGVMGAQDGDIQISLKRGHQPTDGYVRKLREELPRQFPGVTFSFPPADIVSQILNFGSPAPIELQIRGNNLDSSLITPTCEAGFRCSRRCRESRGGSRRSSARKRWRPTRRHGTLMPGVDDVPGERRHRRRGNVGGQAARIAARLGCPRDGLLARRGSACSARASLAAAGTPVVPVSELPKRRSPTQHRRRRSRDRRRARAGNAVAETDFARAVRAMRPGAAIVDVGIDQGGIAETSRMTTLSDPYVRRAKASCITRCPTCRRWWRAPQRRAAQAARCRCARHGGRGIAQALDADPGSLRG